mmetsp:Transcript_24866/g.41431  ORF Transcript_24866/g.41431 Transcript_24866/m.41431 type:complete len:348 (-) Transcript_24866:92-1135(-)
MEISLLLRVVLAILIAFALSYHGLKKKSLSASGASAAVFVGFSSFVCSYRFGLILILFYYSSSKLTKIKQEFKATVEEDYSIGGQRNWMQVLASSFLATVCAMVYFFFCGDDQNISFSESSHSLPLSISESLTIDKATLSSYLWALYLAHYCTANADTWASELGVLSTHNPRLVTSLFLREVPRGTNGGMSLFGTLASGAGGLFIGVVYVLFAFTAATTSTIGNEKADHTLLSNLQLPVLVYSFVCGIVGSLVDSLLGATLQASYYSTERKCIVKNRKVTGDHSKPDPSIICISGVEILSNEAVNLLSIFLTMVLSVWLAPNVFCLVDSDQCYEAARLNQFLARCIF